MSWFTEYVPYEKSVNTTVHNHLAPAAEHTKILKELKEEAQAEIIGSIYANEISCSDVVYYKDELQQYVICKVNMMGETIEVKLGINDLFRLNKGAGSQMHSNAVNELIEKVKDQVSKKITFEFIKCAEIMNRRHGQY